jgi:hypothetical protein
MAIYQYSRQFWFPDGVLSANVPARIFPLNSNALATIYTDATGSTLAANPVITDINGTVSFYAQEGEYWIHIDSEAFRVSVGSPDVDLFETQASDMSTGIIAGGDISVNGSNPAAIDISPMTAYVVDDVTDPRNPAVIRLNTALQTVALDAAALTRTVTWWLISSSGTVVQQATKPSNVQRRTHLVLGLTAQFGGSITVDQSLPVILAQPANQLVDLMDALGSFSITGNMVTPNGANLSVNMSAGTMFARAFSHYIGPALTRNPHIVATVAETPAQYRYITATGLTFGALRSTLDVANYDNAGVITPVGGGAGTATIQRLWLFGSGIATAQLAFQYGQTTYASLTTAIDAIGQSGHVVNPTMTENGALLCHIVVTRTATNLSDTSQARIFIAGKFDTP